MQPYQYRKNFVDRHILPHCAISFPLRSAFVKVAREKFVPHLPLGVVYGDQTVGTDRMDRFLMPPLMLAKIFANCIVHSDHTAMVVAGGGGYTAGILSYLYSTVFLLDSFETPLKPISNVYEDLRINNIIAIQGELRDGLSRQGPFDFIIFDVGLPFVPRSFFSQLKTGGKLIFCLVTAPNFGEIIVVEKQEDLSVSKTVLFEGFLPTISYFSRSTEFVF